jgi:hypothetical protein
LLFYGAVRGILGLLQDVTYAASNWGAKVELLASGLGNLLVIVTAILLILWAVLTRQPETELASGAAPTTEPQPQGAEARDTSAENLDEDEVYKRFLAQPLKTVADAPFQNQRIALDGMYYDRCTFKECTFVCRGEKPFLHD